VCVCVCVCVCVLRCFKTSDDAFRISYSVAFDCSIHPFLDLFHSLLYIFHFSRFSGDGLVFPSFRFPVNQNFLLVALGLFSRHDHTKYISQLYFGTELYMFRTDLLSIIRSLHTVFTAIGICHTSYVDCLLARSGSRPR